MGIQQRAVPFLGDKVIVHQGGSRGSPHPLTTVNDREEVVKLRCLFLFCVLKRIVTGTPPHSEYFPTSRHRTDTG